MPMYDFKRESDGKVVEIFYSMSTVPSIGEVVTHEGQNYTRLVSDYQVSAEVETVTHKYPYVSRSMPKNLAGCETNKKGQPIITSRRHEREIMGRYGLKRD
tara:strand:+ start:79 stop:381 length:303 start_codon:yes stop_codon:yes gene_type:complete